MDVKDVVLSTAAMLGLKERVQSYFESGDEEGKKAVDELLDCYNTIENEIALDYLPLYCEDEVETDTGRITYGTLSRSPVRLFRVTDEAGEKVEFETFPDYFKTKKIGTLKVSYAYIPKKKTIIDQSDYKVQASDRLIAYGTAAEYCLRKGLFEEAAEWEKKYKAALTSAYEAKPSRVMRSRRWA